MNLHRDLFNLLACANVFNDEVEKEDMDDNDFNEVEDEDADADDVAKEVDFGFLIFDKFCKLGQDFLVRQFNFEWVTIKEN